MGKKSMKDATATIKKLWKAYFKTKHAKKLKPGYVNAGLFDVAAALAADKEKGGMPPRFARRYLGVYLREDNSGYIKVRPFMQAISQAHRGAADSVLAVALSLSVAFSNGYLNAVSRKQFKRWYGFEFWKSRWDGDGPDYVLCGGFMNFAFLEVKGLKEEYQNTPNGFYGFKAQSVNARLVGFKCRHILSYAFLPAKGTSARNAVVRWFNQDTVPDSDGNSEPSIEEKALALMIAACQIKTQLEVAGYPGKFYKKLAREAVDGFSSFNTYWIESLGGPHLRLLVTKRVLRFLLLTDELFSSVSTREDVKNVDHAELEKCVSLLKKIWRTPQTFDGSKLPVGIKVAYVYASGLVLVYGKEEFGISR